MNEQRSGYESGENSHELFYGGYINEPISEPVMITTMMGKALKI